MQRRSLTSLPILAAGMIAAFSTVHASEPGTGTHPLLVPPQQVASAASISAMPEAMPVHRSSAGRVDLRVEQLLSGDGHATARVTVRNQASFDLAKITVRCTAFGEDDAAIEVGERTLLSPGDGYLSPGAERSATIEMSAPSEDVRSMSCAVRAL